MKIPLGIRSRSFIVSTTATKRSTLCVRSGNNTLSLQRGEKSLWEALEYLNTLVDDSDPDTDLTQIAHLLQTAEAIRRRRPSSVVCFGWAAT